MKTVETNHDKPTNNILFMLLKAKRNVRKMNDVLVPTETGRQNADTGVCTVFLRWLNHAKH